MAASWPTSVATDSGLYVAVNELQTNLSAGINSAVTTIGLNSTTSFPTVGLVLIDNEIIKYTGVSGLNLTGCTRAFDGTTAASHSSGAVVSFAFCANHHNVLKDEIEAIETYLSNNLGLTAQPLATGSRALASSAGGKITESSVTSTELGYLSGVTSAIQTQLNAAVANPLTSNLACGSHKLTGLAAGSTSGDSVRYEQVIGVFLPLSGGAMTGSISFSTTTGVVGCNGSTAATAGNVGERISSISQSDSAAASSTHWDDITSISLTAGDWDISGSIYWSQESATWTNAQLAISSTAGDDGTGVNHGYNEANMAFASSSTTPSVFSLAIPKVPTRVSSTTTYYLKRRCNYSAGTPISRGYSIIATRVR